MCGSINSYLKWRFVWIDGCIFALRFCIAGIMIGRVRKWVAMQ